ncbi:phospholipase D family protein [Paenibacillus physcomitrellae]|uniref:Phospholipase D n=1 Tax=Paenibacillus physcomitrellae TaxID=1619311 RepID=A0ABQ1GFG6_9BACL|nr:phospholipase D family protein [Paenibacillus physcomitrellae]GGA42774.1 phospholipase D [Paenibacillus physcomitrellae]
MNSRKDQKPGMAWPDRVSDEPAAARRRKRLTALSLAGLVVILVLWLAGVIVYQTHKPLPRGVSYESPEYTVSSVHFLYDLTYPDGQGGIHQERNIVDRMYEMAGEARQYIVLDMFLFNDYVHKGAVFPDVSGELVRRLIDQKKKYPKLQALVITDEININYGSAPNKLFEQLKQAGIRVAITDVNPLRDPTPAYSAVWRTFFQWFGQRGNGWIPNLMASDGPKITLRSYLKLLNVKANHRKVLLTENGALLSTGNVHNASAYHSNIAFEVKSKPLSADILQTEQSVLRFSGGGKLPGLGDEVGAASSALAYSSVSASRSAPAVEAAASASTPAPASPSAPASIVPGPTPPAVSAPTNGSGIRVRYLTEGKISSRVLETLDQLGKGDTLWMGMFYLGDSKVIRAVLNASKRGVAVKLLLDPNENAFGRDKTGIPNRPVAEKLVSRSEGRIEIRWYNTTKEQYHTKLVYAAKASGEGILIGGSANLTPRNLRDYNLENALWIAAPQSSEVVRSVDQYFERLWNNDGATYSLDYKAYRQKSVWFKEIVFNLQNWLGFTTY